MRLFDALAMGFCLVLAINLVILFFGALAKGGQATISVNRFGEMWIEAVFFPLVIIMGIITLIRMLRKL